MQARVWTELSEAVSARLSVPRNYNRGLCDRAGPIRVRPPAAVAVMHFRLVQWTSRLAACLPSVCETPKNGFCAIWAFDNTAKASRIGPCCRFASPATLMITFRSFLSRLCCFTCCDTDSPVAQPNVLMGAYLSQPVTDKVASMLSACLSSSTRTTT